MMGQQRARESGIKEKPEQKEEGPKSDRTAVKKWKGKDWYAIISPVSFGEKEIAQTPATDPKTIVGRNVEVSMRDMMGRQGKDYQKIRFMMERVEGKNVFTRFNGYSCVREFVSRFVRKRSDKIEVISDIRTRDMWELQISSVAIMNRNVDTNIRRKSRAWVNEQLAEAASSAGIDDFVRLIISGTVQHKIKKQGSRIYPIRFFEVTKIEVAGSPAG
jgi:small subunit ribosomal protein S3Ae